MKNIICITLLFLFSCSVNETAKVFDTISSERLNSAKEELRTTLKAATNGWIVTYRPQNNFDTGDLTSVWSLYMKFIDDKNVQISSDFNTSTAELTTSTYAIIAGVSIKLIFDTYNDSIHIFTDVDLSSTGGLGLKGSNSFLFFDSKNNGEELEFRANRDTKNKIKFTKWTSETPPDFKSNLQRQNNILDELTIGDMVLKATDSKGEILDLSAVKISSLLKTMGITTTALENNERVPKDTHTAYFYTFGNDFHVLGYILEGVLDNKSDIVFKIDAAEMVNGFVTYSTTLKNGVKLEMYSSANKLFLPKGHIKLYTDGIQKSTRYFTDDSDIPAQYKSALFDEIADKIPTEINSRRLTIWYQVTRSGVKHDYLFFQGNQSEVNSHIRLKIEIVFKTGYVVFRDAGYLSKSAPKDASVEEKLKDLKKIFFDPKGWYIEDLGRVTRFSNTIYLYTSRANPKIFFATYD